MNRRDGSGEEFDFNVLQMAYLSQDTNDSNFKPSISYTDLSIDLNTILPSELSQIDPAQFVSFCIWSEFSSHLPVSIVHHSHPPSDTHCLNNTRKNLPIVSRILRDIRSETNVIPSDDNKEMLQQ